MRKKNAYLYIICILSIFSFADNNNFLKNNIFLLLKKNDYDTTTVGIVIKKLNSDSIIFSLNSDTKFIPASVQKLVTATIALEKLTSVYTFKTKVYTNSRLNRNNGIIKGDIYIKGEGDPGFTIERMWLFVKHLYNIGIKEIGGDIILDDYFFNQKTDGPGFNEDNSTRAYDASIGALSANFNTVCMSIFPGEKVGDPVNVIFFPELESLNTVSTAKTLPVYSKKQLSIKTKQNGTKTDVYIYGGVGIDEEPFYKYRKAYIPWQYFGEMFVSLLKSNGIKFSGKIIHKKVPKNILSEKPVYIFESEPLCRYINLMLKYSNNFIAEMIFKTLSALMDSSNVGSWKASSKLVLKWWKDNIDSSDIPVILNGSGMGKNNKMTSSQLVKLLEYAADRCYFPEFLVSLPIAGIDGTLKDRFTKSELKCILRAKTGTLNSSGASNLAGFLFIDNVPYVFSILINNKKNSQYSHWILQQRILEVFYDFVTKSQYKK